MRSSVISLCISNNVSDVYENMEFWVWMCVCVHVSPCGYGCIRGCGYMHAQHAWRGRRTTLAHSSGVFPMLLKPRSLTGQELHEGGRGQISWPTSLLLPPLPGWDYRSISPIWAFACYMGSENWNVSPYTWRASTLLAEPSPQLRGSFFKKSLLNVTPAGSRSNSVSWAWRRAWLGWWLGLERGNYSLFWVTKHFEFWLKACNTASGNKTFPWLDGYSVNAYCYYSAW